MDYTEANEYLGKKINRPIGTGRATRLVRNSGVDGDSIHLKLHNTYVVTWYADGRIELNSGGWRTVTTKARINEYLNSGYGIGQERGQWYLTHYDSDKGFERLGVFEDGLTIHPDGKIDGMSPIEDARQALVLRRRVNAFAKEYAIAFSKGEVPKPGNGDCFYCLMKTEDGKTLGESTRDKGHILSHLEEKYFVPSILARAMEVMPTSIAFKQTVHAVWEGKLEFAFLKQTDEWFLTQMRKTISRYLLRQLGQAS